MPSGRWTTRQHPGIGRAGRLALTLWGLSGVLLLASRPVDAAGQHGSEPLQQTVDAPEPPATPAAPAEPAPEPAAAPSAAEGGRSSRPVPIVLQAVWRTPDLITGYTQVSEWVSARQGFSVATDEHHLAVRLPAAEIPAFLEQFASHRADLPAVDPAAPLWITVSLTLEAAP